MLYSITPPEDVWAHGDDGTHHLVCRRVGRRVIYLRVGPDGQPRVERVVSTEPLDYLDPALQPGAAAAPSG